MLIPGQDSKVRSHVRSLKDRVDYRPRGAGVIGNALLARAFGFLYIFSSFHPIATHLTTTNTAAAATMLVAENICNPMNLPPSVSINAPAIGGPVNTARP